MGRHRSARRHLYKDLVGLDHAQFHARLFFHHPQASLQVFDLGAGAGHHTAERGSHSGMHHQAAKEATELFENRFVVLIDMAVIKNVMIVRAGRGHAVINAIEPDGDAYHHRHNGQRIKEGSSFTCKVKVGDSQRTVTITFLDSKGNYEVSRPS